MKKIIFLFVFGLVTYFTNGQQLTCSIYKSLPQEAKGEAVSNLLSDTICLNQTTTFCTDAVANALYSWSVVGTGIQILGSATGSCVTVKGTAAGTYKICLSKSGNGFEPCCNCKTIVVIDCGGGGGGGGAACPPCPTLKIVVDGTNTDNGPWDYACPHDCIRNRVKLNVICEGDPYALKNWMSANGITGTVQWEITNGSIQFTTPLQPCNTDACGTRCDIRNIAFPTYLISAYICPCQNLPFWENFTAKATITFNKNGVTCTKVVSGVIHLYDENTGCGGFRPAATNIQNVKVIPNPVSSNATVKFDVMAEDNFNLFVYDIVGNKVKEIANNVKLLKGTQAQQFNTTGLNQKQYFVVIQNSKGVIVGKEKIMIE